MDEEAGKGHLVEGGKSREKDGDAAVAKETCEQEILLKSELGDG